MRKKLMLVALALSVTGAVTTWGPAARRAAAVGGPYSNDSVRGSYAGQFLGEVFVPAPFDKLNGRFYRTMRIVADGNGRFDVSAVANYGGTIARETFAANYNVNPDGTMTIQVVNLPFPPAPGVPNVFTFDAVLADGGRIAKVCLSGVSLGGQSLPNIGSVITGEFIRQ
jgi:hypothetical protein